LIELQRAVQIAMVGEREGVHAQLFRAVHEPLNGTRSIQETVMAMTMQMNK
jgi:hypothetical protein